MGIRASELYGGEQAAAVALPGQLARFEVPRGTTPSAPFTAPFTIRSVMVDNASGSWYELNGRVVAPWAIGAVVRLDTPSAQLTVTARTPPGQLAEAIGDPLVLVATDAEVEPSPGVYVPPRLGFSLLTAAVGYTVNTAGGGPLSEQLVAAPAAGTRIAVVGLAAALKWDTSNRHTSSELLIGWLPIAGSMVARAVATVSGYQPTPPPQRFEPPLLWPSPGELGVGDAGVTLLGQQPGFASPAEVEVRVDYLLLEGD